MEKDLPTDQANDPLSPGISQEQKPAGASSPRALVVRADQQLQAIAPTRPSTTSDMSATHVLLLRRMRLNRKLLRHLRITRKYRRASSPLLQIMVAVLLVLLALFSGSLGAAYAYYQSQLPVLNDIATHSLFQTTRIYDRNGKLLYELYSNQNNHGRRTYVNYQDIAPVMVQATVAAEDHTFWTNAGISVSGIVRAALTDLASHQIVEGASTITQQLIKNQLFLGEPRTISVKSEEAILALGLTQQYPKWKIMEMYLNTVYYGDLNYGIEAAAESYFRMKPSCTHTKCTPAVARLDLAQASMLAGLPQSPSYYDPTINKPVALARQKVVLDAMVQLGMITSLQAVQAEEEMAKYNFQPFDHSIQAPHFVHYVIDEVLVPLLGAQNLLDGGYNIYTTLDLNLEKQVEKIVYNHLYKVQCDNYLGCYGPLNVVNNVNNGAVVVMSPTTGEILAMDGSADYNNNGPQVRGQYNAALSPRQPGSSFKPIVYATAFQMGWYPAMILPNHKTTYPSNPPYTPNDYGDVYLSGFPMTIRNALANSINIPAIDAIEYTGIPAVVNTAERMCLSELAQDPPSSFGPSMAIGTKEVSLLDMTQAYSVFANGGVRVPPVSVLEITDSSGHPLYTFDAAHPHGVRVLGQDVAFLMSSILSDKAARYHEFFPGNPLEMDFPAAAKTGTTDSFRDNWTMGYTPYLTVGVWVGNSDNSAMNNVIGITGAGPIWHDVMQYATDLYHYPPKDFVRPPDVQAATVSAYTGLLAHPGEPTVTDWFIDGTEPTIYGSGYTPVCLGPRCNKNGGH